MKKIHNVLKFSFLLLVTQLVSAGNLKSLQLYYDEVEEAAGGQTMRYLINSQYVRIDSGDTASDFILFDVNKNKIFSINHQDKTILTINAFEWKQPKFDFKVAVEKQKLEGAPKIANKPVFSYSVNAGDKTCTRVYYIKDTYADYMNVMYKYQQILSGQQVATLKNTPKEFHTPCFLLDQVYHTGEYYRLGLPVQIVHSRGYIKSLKDFKETSVSASLFLLPEGYSDYKPFSE